MGSIRNSSSKSPHASGSPLETVQQSIISRSVAGGPGLELVQCPDIVQLSYIGGDNVKVDIEIAYPGLDFGLFQGNHGFQLIDLATASIPVPATTVTLLMAIATTRTVITKETRSRVRMVLKRDSLTAHRLCRDRG